MKNSMTIQSVGQQRRLLEWSQRVADCRQSGISVKRWCSENGTTPKTYYTWQKKVFSAMVEQQQFQLAATQESTDVCFAELPAAPIPQASTKAPVASIRLGETAVDIYEGADAKMVEALCRALKSC